MQNHKSFSYIWINPISCKMSVPCTEDLLFTVAIPVPLTPSVLISRCCYILKQTTRLTNLPISMLS